MLWLILYITLWGVIHSLLASIGTRKYFRTRLGDRFIRGYRLLYNAFSIISVTPIFWLFYILPDRPLYSIPTPWRNLMLIGQALSMVFLVVGVMQTDALAFVGIRQLFEDQPAQFISSGLYRYVRHPLYFFGLLFLWLTPSASLNSFIIQLSFSSYLIVGAYFEEKKLAREYGQTYVDYKRVTPMFIPRLL